MLSLYEIFGILIIHWIADFICQKDADAKGKSTSMYHLMNHITDYQSVWFAFGFAYWIISGHLHILKLVLFIFITGVCHTITDYFTSRWVKKSFDKQDYHNGFVKIGFDQLLHYAQLFLTYYFLIK